ncbi:HAUS augmin-like complex subunit 8 [Dunckerocampus dactyliophorus]|uniref:HAUS augmin-like complex subunit 8 n=1 Tax=Dunckerocampus dactyliophorus TaxID=161453 RepID=UPI0024051879|nr:HAUS augmin-like complex subunit 8 [Dunckerocampus dactyliophorus]
MASRRTTQMPSSIKNSAADAKSSKSGNTANKTTKNATGKKPTVVQSRYMQTPERTLPIKSKSLNSDSVSVLQRPSSPKPSEVKLKVGTPPRCSMGRPAFGMSKMSRESEPSLLGKTILQSTFSDGHCGRPDFDISVIRGKTIIENAEDAEKNPENQKQIIEMQSFLLCYLSAKMASNTGKLEAEAEARLLQKMEDEEVLHREVMKKKREYLLMQKEQQANELLDMQISALTPVADIAQQFTKSYNSFASAVDTTRHELPVKNLYIDGDRREFLDKAEACLKESEELLRECTEGDDKENGAVLECLRGIKSSSKDMSQQLSGAFSELQELSSLICRHRVQVQQAAEEEQLGVARSLELFCPKR